MGEAAIDYLATIASESDRIAQALARGPLDAPVVDCPGWTLRDLGVHLGDVQRWCTQIVITGLPSESEHDLGDADLESWFQVGTTGLLRALEDASPDAECWTLSGTGTVSFWHRRQALEAAVHRWDADAATGSTVPIDPTIAADVVDEWIDFRVRRKFSQDSANFTVLGGNVHLQCTDVPGEWTFGIADGQLVIVEEHQEAAVSVKGTANDLALFVYRRGNDAEVGIFGDTDLLSRWFSAMS